MCVCVYAGGWMGWDGEKIYVIAILRVSDSMLEFLCNVF